VAVVAALVVYALLSHALMVHAPAEPWTVAALFGPLLAAMTAGAITRRHLPSLAFCALLAAALVAVVRGGAVDINRLYVLQHAGIHLALAATFGATLRRGATPLITAAAARIHRNFTPAMRAYTRRLTALWTAYFVAMIVLSATLYLLAPWSWWSLFCNVATPLSALALFVGEYVWRGVRHPDFEPVTLAGMARAFRAQRAAEVK